MRRLVFLFRLITFGIIFSFPFVVIGLAILGAKGIGIGLGLAFFILILAFLGSEWTLARVCQGDRQAPMGLLHLSDIAESLPKIWVYPEPFPEILIARRGGSHGSVFLSQGLVASLSYEELYSTVKICIGRMQDPTIVLRSFSATLAFWLLKMAPRDWVSLVFFGGNPRNVRKPHLTSWMALLFLIPYFFVQYLRRVQKELDEMSPVPSVNSIPIQTALRKIHQSIQVLGYPSARGPDSLFSVLENLAAFR